ncbi:methyltransferase domain-containing protein [Sphingorhabdus sp. IMCC26285]|uniref:Methyltransferase domain-containing protein n=1 Tax=Sphingorhabdus profundilacus TaxID=2509718 RepID=A0A6I4LTS2_9SPHN|nr:class I SAM-dependent methyltransferase [Sphingorhabdus profundilacus]MVZ96877.1 methyltransferase domain-containing protein [Sphingorhabdus profundilacus]
MFNKLYDSNRANVINEQDMAKRARFEGTFSYDYIADENSRTAVMALEDHIMRLQPGLVDKLERGIDVADISCGTGQAINQLAKLYPNSRFTGFDACAEDILVARMEAEEMGLTNIRFEAVDASTLGSDVVFDLILPSTRYMIRRFDWQNAHTELKVNVSN